MTINPSALWVTESIQKAGKDSGPSLFTPAQVREVQSLFQ